MQHFKRIARVNFFLLMSFTSLLLVGCKTNCERYHELLKKPAKNTSYYPYLSQEQYDFFHKQNIISIIPGGIIMPSHEVGTLEYQLNAENWWGSWPNEVKFTNYFLAEQGKRILGCGPLKMGAEFNVPAGIYTYKQKKISLASALTWKLTANIETMCLTKSYLPLEYYSHDSIYWMVSHSQNRIDP
jgi:hypothetical protein